MRDSARRMYARRPEYHTKGATTCRGERVDTVFTIGPSDENAREDRHRQGGQGELGLALGSMWAARRAAPGAHHRAELTARRKQPQTICENVEMCCFAASSASVSIASGPRTITCSPSSSLIAVGQYSSTTVADTRENMMQSLRFVSPSKARRLPSSRDLNRPDTSRAQQRCPKRCRTCVRGPSGSSCIPGSASICRRLLLDGSFRTASDAKSCAAREPAAVFADAAAYHIVTCEGECNGMGSYHTEARESGWRALLSPVLSP